MNETASIQKGFLLQLDDMYEANSCYLQTNFSFPTKSILSSDLLVLFSAILQLRKQFLCNTILIVLLGLYKTDNGVKFRSKSWYISKGMTMNWDRYQM